MVQTRDQIAPQDKWNVEALYPSLQAWEAEFKAFTSEEKAPHWPQFATYRNRLKESVATFKAALELQLALSRQIEKLYTYAHLKYDEEMSNDAFKTAYGRISSLLHDFQEELSWFEPEMLSLPQEILDNYLKAPELQPYHFHLLKIMRMRPHTLPPEQEALIAAGGKAFETIHRAYSSFNNADLTFPKVKDSANQEQELSHGSYTRFIRSQDRLLRQNAFETMHHTYQSYTNLLGDLIQGEMQLHTFNARARHFKSCLDAALFPKDVDPRVYHALISTVHENLSALHDYLALRQEVMQLTELHLYDLYVPLVKEVEFTFSYQEAEELVIQSVRPLGEEYHQLLSKGMREERWTDRYENKNKRSGAYSSGCYDSMPYILMNFQGQINDVFTLAHEAGHSMHSLLSRIHQPYHYSSYPIFVAEVASTFNEALLARLLLKRAKSTEEKLYLINQQLEAIRTTLLRQTLFAEFELWMHEQTEKGVPLTPALLNQSYYALNKRYFGPHIVVDAAIGSEWARIPHFYYNFYVYQYATGISAAWTLAEKVCNGGAKERDAYLSFLKGGCSRFPLDLLKQAGVDMTSPEPISSALKQFRALIKEFRTIWKKG